MTMDSTYVRSSAVLGRRTLHVWKSLADSRESSSSRYRERINS
jgi:hypothetical protein